MTSEINALQACKYLYLHSIAESDEGGIRLIVHEATSSGPVDHGILAAETQPEVRKLLAQCSAIVHGPGCKVFTITWATYIGYSVENESYALPEPPTSVSVGRLFIEYTKSVYLEYLAKRSFASAEYPGPFKHWAVHCLDHIINVASTEQPTIEVGNYA
ncbi:MAG TPA: hypothetical protein VM532_02795 [Burkholderiales bacterium]|jgi:hypothetical protein|nr:hypothetical protein [Burkholderiales bacterium]